jgi:hypothetical protein
VTNCGLGDRVCVGGFGVQHAALEKAPQTIGPEARRKARQQICAQLIDRDLNDQPQARGLGWSARGRCVCRRRMAADRREQGEGERE